MIVNNVLFRSNIMSGIRDSLRKCPNCKKTSIILDEISDELFCSKCGFVISEKYQESTIRATSETNIGSNLIVNSSTKDAHGQSINANQKHFEKLKRLHGNRIISSVEKNRNQAIYEIEGLKGKLALPDAAIESAKQTYQKITKRGITRGYSTKGHIGACVYASCRITDTPKTIDTKKTEIKRSYKRIVRELELTIPITDPIRFVPKIANNMGLSENIQNKAREIIQQVTETGRVAGTEPRGLVAGALYLAALNTKESTSLKKIAKESGVTEGTIANRCNDIVKITEL